MPFTGNSLHPDGCYSIFNCEVMMSFIHSLVLDSDNQNFKTSITTVT